mgnify:CR=1 FL=1
MTPEGVNVKHSDKVWIGGEWRAASTGSMSELVSPNTEQVIGSVAEAGEADMDAAVAAAREAFDHGPWGRMSPAERFPYMKAMADHLETRVSVQMSAKRGKMTVEFADLADLERIYRRITDV